MKKGKMSFRSSMFSKSIDNGEGRSSDGQMGISFTQIPRQVESSRQDIFFQPRGNRRSTYFESAQSQCEYSTELSPAPSRSKSKIRHLPTKNEEKLWKYFVMCNNDFSPSDSEDLSTNMGKDSRKSGKSVTTSKSQDKNQYVPEDVPEILEEEETKSILIPQPEQKKQEPARETKIIQRLMLSKTIQHSVLPTKKIKASRMSVLVSSKKQQEQPIGSHIFTMSGPNELKFVSLKEQKRPLVPGLKKMFPPRRTAIKPLRYWLGERMVRRKDQIVGMLLSDT